VAATEPPPELSRPCVLVNGALLLVFLNEHNELRLCVDRDGTELTPLSLRVRRGVARGQPKAVAENAQERATLGQRSASLHVVAGGPGGGDVGCAASGPDFHSDRAGRKTEILEI
jgi:hypothetical protein